MEIIPLEALGSRFLAATPRKDAVSEFTHFFWTLIKMLLLPNECFLKWGWNDNYRMELRPGINYSETLIIMLPTGCSFVFLFSPPSRSWCLFLSPLPWGTTWKICKPISVLPFFLSCKCYLLGAIFHSLLWALYLYYTRSCKVESAWTGRLVFVM